VNASRFRPRSGLLAKLLTACLLADTAE